ncbi:hypothetical protein HZC09_05690 [Candidatus Micrarchaeota archaeon]|nr:hypothetical protein [Candidatus Micrarchaeota archaeon]
MVSSPTTHTNRRAIKISNSNAIAACGSASPGSLWAAKLTTNEKATIR